MQTHYLLTFLFFLPSYCLHILLPLYSYPQNGAWKPIWNQVAAHPTVEFQLIINPDSGPGSSQYPEPAYITALTRLNKLPNVKLLGYIATGWASRPVAETLREIDKYAGWASYRASNISISGIFFDEATDSTNAAQMQYMRDVSAHAYATITSRKPLVVFNPGTVVDKRYFAMADTIVQFENPFADYASLTTIDTFQKGFKKQSAVIAHSTTVGPVKLRNMVKAAQSSNLGGLYFTSDCCYNTLNGTLLNQLATAISG